LIPAANMGEYEPPRERPEDGGLYPLNAEGTYGRVPKSRNPGRWQELPKYQKREKKPKLYASYAIRQFVSILFPVISASCMLSCWTSI